MHVLSLVPSVYSTYSFKLAVVATVKNRLQHYPVQGRVKCINAQGKIQVSGLPDKLPIFFARQIVEHVPPGGHSGADVARILLILTIVEHMGLSEKVLPGLDLNGTDPFLKISHGQD